MPLSSSRPPAVFLKGQAPAARYAGAAEAIRTAGLRDEYAFKLLERLTSSAGPRLTGSSTAAAAVELTRTMMDELGFETWLEPVMVQHWVRGVETARIVRPARRKSRFSRSRPSD